MYSRTRPACFTTSSTSICGCFFFNPDSIPLSSPIVLAWIFTAVLPSSSCDSNSGSAMVIEPSGLRVSFFPPTVSTSNRRFSPRSRLTFSMVQSGLNCRTSSLSHSFPVVLLQAVHRKLLTFS